MNGHCRPYLAFFAAAGMEVTNGKLSIRWPGCYEITGQCILPSEFFFFALNAPLLFTGRLDLDRADLLFRLLGIAFFYAWSSRTNKFQNFGVEKVVRVTAIKFKVRSWETGPEFHPREWKWIHKFLYELCWIIITWNSILQKPPSMDKILIYYTSSATAIFFLSILSRLLFFLWLRLDICCFHSKSPLRTTGFSADLVQISQVCFFQLRILARWLSYHKLTQSYH